MRSLGIGHLIKEGCVRRTILAALNDADVQKPYDLEIPETEKKLAQIRSQSHLPAEEENTLEEFAWAFGSDTVRELEEALTRSSSISIRCLTLRNYPTGLRSISKTGMPLVLWTKMRSCTESNCISMKLPKELHKEHGHILELIEKRRSRIREKILEEHPELASKLEQNRKRLEERLEQQNPEAMKKWREWKKKD